MYGFPDGATTPEVSEALTLRVTVTRPELISTELGETVNEERTGESKSLVELFTTEIGTLFIPAATKSFGSLK